MPCDRVAQRAGALVPRGEPVALVIAASVVLGDAIWFLYSLIGGGLTLRFFLDSIVLLVLGGGVFAYYLTTIDGPQKE